MQFPVERPLIVIVGPTAVGKTDLSIELAKDLNGEIVSADSRYLYKGMNIGTAKPDEGKLAEIKHHLIDVADIESPWSLAVYQEEALAAIENVLERGSIPILVGGTGQYIRAIIEGWKVPRLKSNDALRTILRQWADEIGPEGLYRRLSVLDKEAAENIDYRNLRRTIRALEVILSTGEKFSNQRRRNPINFQYKMIGLYRPREVLYQRIDFRIEKMIEEGFIAEVKGLLSQGYSLSDSPMTAIGYREVTQHLQDKMEREEALKSIKRRTKIFVRRQANWFKSDDPRIVWFDMNDHVKEEILKFIKDGEGWNYE